MAILSKGDRELLSGEKDNASDVAKVRQQTRLRRRIRQAINDFPFLLEELEPDDYEAIFRPKRAKESAPDIKYSAMSMLAVIIRGFDGDPEIDFEDVLRMAIQRVERIKGHRVDPEEIEISIEVKNREPLNVIEFTGKCPSCDRDMAVKFGNQTISPLVPSQMEIKQTCTFCDKEVKLSPNFER